MGAEHSDLRGLQGRVAIVTGASSGIGRHIAELLVRQGVRVVGLARRAPQLQELEERHGQERFRGIAVDLGDPDEIECSFAEIEACFGPCDILVNAAGMGIVKPATEHSLDDWQRSLAINLTAPFELSRRVVAARQGEGGLSIINVSSPAATRASRGLSSYAASKAALVQLSRVLALEWARLGVRVNCLSPGHMPTELNGGLVDRDEVARIERAVPMGRIGALDELDGAVLLLAGEDSEYITGIELAVDGGVTLR